MKDEIEIEMSRLCQPLESDGRTIRVEIYRAGKGDWLLEIVDEATNDSIVWEEEFRSDQEAFDFLWNEIVEKGLDSVIDEAPKAQLPEEGV